MKSVALFACFLVVANGLTMYVIVRPKEAYCCGGLNFVRYSFGCPAGWSRRPFSFSCYKVFTKPLSFFSAIHACKDENSRMVEINSQEEEQFLTANMRSRNLNESWIGAMRGPTTETYLTRTRATTSGQMITVYHHQQITNNGGSYHRVQQSSYTYRRRYYSGSRRVKRSVPVVGKGSFTYRRSGTLPGGQKFQITRTQVVRRSKPADDLIPATYVNYPKEIANKPGNRGCVSLRRLGNKVSRWYPKPCSSKRAYVCEQRIQLFTDTTGEIFKIPFIDPDPNNPSTLEQPAKSYRKRRRKRSLKHRRQKRGTSTKAQMDVYRNQELQSIASYMSYHNIRKK